MKKRKNKAASLDFLPTQLPQTRKDQYFFILKNQFTALLLSGLWLLLCCFPLILTVYFQNQFEIGFYQKYVSGEMNKTDYQASMNALMIYGSIIEVAFTFVASFAIAGVNRILKSLVSGEPILFWDDFKCGVKQNYLNTCLLLFFFSILLGLCRFVNAFFIEYLLGIPCYILLILIVIPVFTLASIFSSVYECNIFHAISNAIKLYFPFWWKYLLMSLGIAAVFTGLNYLETLPFIVAIVQTVLCVLVLPLYLLLLYSISFSLFDKYINQEEFPEFYGSGLYRPKEEDQKK